MKSLRLLALALLTSSCCASLAFACDAPKSAASGTSATAVSASKSVPTVPRDGGCSAEVMSASSAGNAKSGVTGCSASMAAQCTPAMRAACEKNAAVAAAMDCTHASGTSAVTASNTKDKDICSAHAAGMMANGKCDAKGAMARGANCPMHGSAAMTMAAAGMLCSEHMSGVAHECSACDAWADCDQAVRALGARTQVVSLKNGAMIVYTAESNADIKALQSLVSKRNDKMVAALSASSDKKLCDECKQLRGAMASGKLHREVVNVERGCLTLITSEDRGLVQKIRAMTGQPVAMR